MKARGKQSAGKKSKAPKRVDQDLYENKENLEHRIRALKKIIRHLREDKNN
jgi:hypothetical protein